MDKILNCDIKPEKLKGYFIASVGRSDVDRMRTQSFVLRMDNVYIMGINKMQSTS